MTEDKKFIVYIATHTESGNEYIGCTSQSLRTRRLRHEDNAKNGRYEIRFARALADLGLNSFEWRVTAEFETRDEARAEEQRLIQERTPHYNATPGGKSYAQKRLSDEVKERLRVAGLRDREKWLERSHLGPAASAKKVICLNDGTVHESARAAGRAYGLANNSITTVCKRSAVRMTAGGLTFRYADDVQPDEQPVQEKNQTGYRGVSKHGKRYRAVYSPIGSNRRKVIIGTYDTPEEAAEIYEEAISADMG